MAKTTTISSILGYNLTTNAYTGAMAAAPRDKQAWRVTKEHIRPRFLESQNGILTNLIGAGKNTESEIDLGNHSKYLAGGAWVTGDSLRGPHVNLGFADEMQDWTREAFEVFKEVVNLPPARIFCAGTPKLKGSFFEELWLSSDMKEWNGKEWIASNPDADPGISGYHITQEWSPFVTKRELEQKRRKMSPRMYANEVLAKFYSAGGAKPITPDQLMSLLIREPYSTDLTGITRSLGVDWGNETRWVMLGQRPDGRLIVLDSGVLDDADTLKHVDAVSTMIARESPAWTVCDSGYGKTKNQMLMRAFPGRVWSCFSNSSSNTLPSWNVMEELNGIDLKKEDWQYHVSINHTVMCENIENLVAKKDMQFCYYPDQRDRMDTFFYELTQADTEEVNTKHGKERRFMISPAHGYAALAYAALPFIEQTMEDVLSAPVRFARGRRF
ncbi:MAG: hypothetical protein SCH70_03360 [Candidatus Methanoperedens sp.]|nr:hypothetical protein [Candidatus Methanoperedens sp.]